MAASGAGAAPGLPPRSLCWEGEGGKGRERKKKKKKLREKRGGKEAAAELLSRLAAACQSHSPLGRDAHGSRSPPPPPSTHPHPVGSPGDRTRLPPPGAGRAGPGVSRNPAAPRGAHVGVGAAGSPAGLRGQRGRRYPGRCPGRPRRGAAAAPALCDCVLGRDGGARDSCFSQRSFRRRSRGKARPDPAGVQHRIPVPPVIADERWGRTGLLIVGPPYPPPRPHRGELVSSGKTCRNRQGAGSVQHTSVGLLGRSLQWSSTSKFCAGPSVSFRPVPV